MNVVRVLLISTNRERKPSFAIPIGVAHLQTALIHAGFEAEILDLCFCSDEELQPTVGQKLHQFPADLIGISIRNIDNETFLQYRGNLGDVRLVVETCRQESSAPIVVGGSAFSLMPEEIMRTLNVQLGVVGEGETAIVALAEAIKQGLSFHQVPGLVTLVEASYQGAEPARVQNMSTVVSPEHFVPDERYFSTQVVGPQPTYGVQTKRGCAFRCSYCPVPSIEGKPFRLRQPEEIVNEIRHLQKTSGLQRVFFTDSIINIPRRHALAFTQAMIDARLNVRWMAYANPLQFTQDMADQFVEAGCQILNFGIDAACEEMLASLQKDFSVEDIYNATAFCKKAGIRVIHSLLLGGPNESPETVQKTLEAVSKMAPHILTIAIGIRLYPQTPLWRKLHAQLPQLEQANVLDPIFYLEPRLTRADREQILHLIQEFSQQQPHIPVKMNFNLDSLIAEETEQALQTALVKGAAL